MTPNESVKNFQLYFNGFSKFRYFHDFFFSPTAIFTFCAILGVMETQLLHGSSIIIIINRCLSVEGTAKFMQHAAGIIRGGE